MRLFLSIVLSVMFLQGFILGQIPDNEPEILIPLQVYDNGTIPGGKILEFGIDQTGSDSLDFDLGELELPPPPPAGVFFTRFFIPLGDFSQIASFRDIRNSSGYPFTGSHEYRIRYQVAEGATFIVFKWDLPLGITGLIQDLFGGVLINKSMAGQDSVVVSNFVVDQLKMVIDYQAVVPVELSSFTAKVSNRLVRLEWRTESELNNAGFEIEKRASFSDWESIGFVKGKGTTTQPTTYSYSDSDKLMFRTYFYRLKQIDFDGSFSYSSEIEVELSLPEKFQLNQNFPNPFNPSTTISFSLPHSAFVNLSIYNIIGEKVAEVVNGQLDGGNYNYIWNPKDMNSGVYLYELRTEDYKSIRKMQLIK
jgi:hypothetical protein